MAVNQKSYEFYIAQAEAAAKAADRAILANVRDRELRSEKTWRGLAEQARRVSAGREKAEQERAARQQAELAEKADLAV